MTDKAKIIYTITDEAPALATRSFLPIVKAFTKSSNIEFETKDISLAGRILANFSDYLSEEQRVEDALSQLGELAKKPEANIIKLPNISASVPQLESAIKELQALGYSLPDYPETADTAEKKDILARYNKVKGSAVNPVLREGNSDRRAPRAVKNYAKKNPHSMGSWSEDSQSHVATMKEGDFAHSEKSTTVEGKTHVAIVHTDKAGLQTVLKNGITLQDKEIIDAAIMSRKALISFLEEEIKDAKEKGLLFSLHMKATMMKVSDPIIFGHAVRVFFKEIYQKHGDALKSVGVDVNNGFGNLLSNIKELPSNTKADIEADIASAFENNPDLAMVDSDRGITNLHVPSDIIIDASMPAMIRTSGKMWNKDGRQQDTKAVIPDSSYSGIYQATIDFCKMHGAFDPTSMGTVPNVGLMAQKAEEYGSHDKTFEITSDGKVEVMGYNPKKREPNFLKQLYYLPEEFYLPNTSVKFYIKANAVFYPNFDYELMDIQMQKFEIPINNRLSKMSYGQKKKFLIAFALATKCKLLILDEPTNGLDIPSKSIFRKMLAGALSEDQLVLISTHQVKDVENLIDRIIILDHGQMIMNREIIDISEKYQFTTVRDTKSIEPLYEESGPIASRVIVPGNGNSSSVDIELLFNATTSGIKLT